MRHIGTQPFETARLLCRPFVPEDCEAMFRNWVSDPRVQPEYGEPVYATLPETRALLTRYLENYRNPDVYRWAIVRKSDTELIGQIAFCRVYSDCRTAEIEYCIGVPFQGNGYAGEALSGLLEFTFRNTDFEKLEAYHRIENIKSGRVLEKSAMSVTDTVERFRRERVLPRGEVCYCISKEHYPQNND